MSLNLLPALWLLLWPLANPAPWPVPSCTCEMPATATEARQHADAVFTAVVDRVSDTLVTEGTLVGQRMQLAHLWVTRVWKGRPPRVLRMVGTQSGADCMMRFEAGREYLLYALRVGDALVTSWCLRSRPAKDAEDDIAELGLAIE